MECAWITRQISAIEAIDLQIEEAKYMEQLRRKVRARVKQAIIDFALQTESPWAVLKVHPMKYWGTVAERGTHLLKPLEWDLRDAWESAERNNCGIPGVLHVYI